MCIRDSTWLVFGPLTVAEHPVLRTYMLLPLMAWIAFRFSPRDAAGTLLLIAIVALWNTRLGYGIFASAADSPSERLVEVQTFLMVLTLLGLLLSVEISERRETTEALRRSEEGLKRAQRHARVGSWTWDVKGDRLEWSDEMFRIFGLRRETFTGSLQAVIAEAIHPEDRAAVERSNLSVVRDRRPIPLEYRVVRPDGSVRVVWAEAGEFLPDEHGDPLLLSGTVRDITEQKEAEANKARLESQLQHAIKMESVGRLAGGVAHDFNNMLGVILGHMELALEQVDSSHPVHADLIATQQAAQRSAHLTRQLLAFARKQAVVPRVLDLNETVAGMLTMLERLIGEDIEISFSPAGGLWPVSMDPSQIDQILANLCVNARDAIAGTGCISIETTNESLDEDHCVEHPGCIPGDYVRLVVADDGRGMDEETRRHLFEPFFTTKNTGEGTGLGLATVYGIVEQNGGFIEVESEAGEGCTFTIYLPRHVGDAPPADTGEPRGSSTRGREIILVVEDEPAILDLATRMLRRQGYIVLAAATPAQAFRLAEERQGDIDLLVTDVVMPEMNGRDLADTLRTYAPRMRRLFMSGYTADVIASRGVLDDGVNFLEKPFTAQGFAAAVREVLSRE